MDELIYNSWVYHPNADTFLRREDIPNEIKELPREDRERLGYYALSAVMPPVQPGCIAVAVGYTRTDLGYKREWEEMEVEPVKYYTVDILTAIGSVCGSDRYDAIKSALSLSRIGGVPVWDMLISGMYIPATDPRLAMIRNALVESELVSDEEFDKILAIAASDEPVPESGAEE